MTHTFLLEAGRWTLEGHWLESDRRPVAFTGKTLVAWNQDNWFTIVTKLIFSNSERPEMIMQYRGRLGVEDQSYTFVLQHSQLGRVEGEGWLGPTSIVQRFWVLDTRDRRSGFETIYRLSDKRYCLMTGIMAGHSLLSTMEATLERQPN